MDFGNDNYVNYFDWFEGWVKMAMRKCRFGKLTMEISQKISNALKREEDKIING